ncbi:unnamed protein product, partial [Coregonus sp. 'balchen']
MDGSVAKKTQDTLGKVIKKPPLTEKLLSKPPFRYLHDIFSEVIRTTGFMKGLYAETEMKSDNVKDKDAKIAFLQKALDVVMLVNGEPLSAKPARIKDPDLPKEHEGRRGDKDKERHRVRERSKKGRDRDRTKDRDKDKSRDREMDKDNEREKDRERDKERERDRVRDERERDRDGEKSKDKESHRERDRERDKEKDFDRVKRPDKERDKGEKEREPRHKQGEEKGNKKARASEETKHRPHPEEPSKTAKPEPASDSPARIPRPSSAKGQRRRPKAGGQQDGDTPLAERPVPLENGDATDAVPAHMAHRRIPRPSSARPAPPRVKRQESYTDVTPAERLTSAKPLAAVITEGKKLSEDEDEQFVVTQSLVSEASRKKERDLVSREIERLRSSIQTVVTDSAVEPLKAELAELEQLIKEQQDKICAVKSNVLKNEDKIQKMVTSINFSSRI